jgi:hypothetical protein
MPHGSSILVIIIGGGAVMDAVGLAAALLHRGLRQVRADHGAGAERRRRRRETASIFTGKIRSERFAAIRRLNDFEFLLRCRIGTGSAASRKPSSHHHSRPQFFDWLWPTLRDFPRD